MIGLAALLVGLTAACGVKIHARKAGIPSTKLKDPKPIEVDGLYRHAGTGIEFPERVPGWQRSAAKQYDEEGHDVGIGYAPVGKPLMVNLTLYVFPAPWLGGRRPADFESHMAAERENLSSVLGGISPLVERKDADGRVHALEFESRQGPFGVQREIMVLHPRGDWRLKYRMTVPAAQRDEAVRGLRKLLEALGLPPTGLATD